MYPRKHTVEIMSLQRCLNVIDFYPFMPSGIFYLDFLDRSISYIWGVWLVIIISCFVEIPERNANSVDPDQTPRSAASDQRLHCLPLSFYRTLGLNGLRGFNTLAAFFSAMLTREITFVISCLLSCKLNPFYNLLKS